MAVSAIQQISAAAKKIRRAHPKKAWKDCIKAASVAYKKNKKPARKISGVAKGAARRPAIKKPQLISGVKSAPRKAAPRKAATIPTRGGAMDEIRKQGNIRESAAGKILSIRGRPKTGLSAAEKNADKKAIVFYQKTIRAASAHISNLKKLL